MPLTVACVLKSGGIYDAKWVERLRAGVAKHLPIEHRFVCLSDVDVPCERIPLEHDWPGWWAKIELFKLEGPVLYLDLDSAVVGDLSDMAQQADQWEFTLLRDFYRLGDRLGSGVMAWNVDVRNLYDIFLQSSVAHEKTNGGDQVFIENNVNLNAIARWQDRLPGQLVSYKFHCQGGPSPINGQVTKPGIPENARVVCLHGHPRFVDMPANDEVRVAWEMAA